MPSSEISANLDFGPLNDELAAIAQSQGEDPDKVCAIIQEFRDMIFEKGDFTPHRTDTEFLTKFLRARYWRVESSYNLLKNYYSFRRANKELYEKVHPLDLKPVGDAGIVTVVPYKDQLGRRIIIYRFGNWIPSKIPSDDIFKASLLLLEVGALEPSVQVLGGVGIFDLSNLSLNHLLHLTPAVAQRMLALVITSMPIRTNALHIVHQNWAFNAAYSVFKPFLNAKIRERIFIHGSDMSSLHKHIFPENLPKRYGGIHEEYPYVMWIALTKNEKIKNELESLGYVVDTKDINLEQYFT
ncbi:clavesin-2-like [Condylostylus longicornis]|uniref:clavesin-2-like n=1 Tax=Condylostylus longicornis TaxID=2530218 RepID=UPI00244DAF70|nr:clavesin-2-like [Condylostylus longicornis]XP_055384320.1 clavesin-2-like [Condylostylus longicornis]